MDRRKVLCKMAQGGAVMTAGLLGASAVSAASNHHTAARKTAFAPMPIGYVDTGHRLGVPPIILYGVALQESQKLFGNQALPYPWTLNVAGTPYRFASYEAAVIALRAHVTQGTTSVDCGLMQVNWKCHHAKLGNFYHALDPYPNLEAGGLILHDEFIQTGNWYAAVGRYHSPDPVRAEAYAKSAFSHMVKVLRA
jgi:hypothetical protein